MFTGLTVLCVAIQFWSLGIMTGIFAATTYLEYRGVTHGNLGTQGRYHSNHSLLCALRVQQNEEELNRLYFEDHGPVADAPPEHTEEYTMLALQEGACLRHLKHLRERMAELRGEALTPDLQEEKHGQ